MNPEWTWKQECLSEPEVHSRLWVIITFPTRLILAQLDHYKRDKDQFSNPMSGHITPIETVVSLLSANQQV